MAEIRDDGRWAWQASGGWGWWRRCGGRWVWRSTRAAPGEGLAEGEATVWFDGWQLRWWSWSRGLWVRGEIATDEFRWASRRVA